MSGFSRTPEGKATVAAFVDAYNGMMISRRDYKAQDVNGDLGRVGALKVNYRSRPVGHRNFKRPLQWRPFRSR